MQASSQEDRTSWEYFKSHDAYKVIKEFYRLIMACSEVQGAFSVREKLVELYSSLLNIRARADSFYDDDKTNNEKLAMIVITHKMSELFSPDFFTADSQHILYVKIRALKISLRYLYSDIYGDERESPLLYLGF